MNDEPEYYIPPLPRKAENMGRWLHKVVDETLSVLDSKYALLTLAAFMSGCSGIPQSCRVALELLDEYGQPTPEKLHAMIDGFSKYELELAHVAILATRMKPKPQDASCS